MLTLLDDKDNSLLIWACESRNSDSIMIITAGSEHSDINNMFDDDAWRSAKYFNKDDYETATKYVVNVINKSFLKDDKHLDENYRFNMNKSLLDIEHIHLDAKSLEYEDYYDLATFEFCDRPYFCDLIILNGEMGLRYSKYNDQKEYDNLTFEKWNPDLSTADALKNGMKDKLKDFIEKEINYEIEIGIGI